MWARVIRQAFMIFVAASSLAFVVPTVALCQSCCVLPNQEMTTPSKSESDSTYVGEDFVQTISNQQQPTLSYDGYSVHEVQGAQGNNGCYFTGSELGQHPGIFGPGGSTWQVGSANQWGYDFIGFDTVDAQQIWQAEEAGGVPDGCDTVTYQTMQIDCSGLYQNYLTNIEQDRFVYSNESMKACRSSVSPNSCSGSIIIPPS